MLDRCRKLIDLDMKKKKGEISRNEESLNNLPIHPDIKASSIIETCEIDFLDCGNDPIKDDIMSCLS